MTSKKVETASFKFYPGEYLRDTQNLSEGQQVAYDRIMCEHIRDTWISMSQFRFFTKRLSPDEREEILLVLEAVETEKGPGFIIPWVAREVSKSLTYNQTRLQNLQKTDMEPHIEPGVGIGIMVNGNGKKEKEKEKGKTEKTEKPKYPEAREVLKTLNDLAGTDYRMTTALYLDMIVARLNDNFTVQELKDIIAVKVTEWKGRDMERYLHPETLFNRTKCTKYRDEVRRVMDKGLTAADIRGREHGGPKGMDAGDLARAAMQQAKDVFK